MKSLPQPLGTRGRFEPVRKLGEGGMGSVYEALDRERNERVAVKLVSEGNATLLQPFKHEFRALTDLEHPTLVRLGELHEAEGEWFITMELVPGTDLLSYVTDGTFRASPPLEAAPQSGRPVYDEARLRGSFQQLAVGLRALHLAGKVSVR
jgi:serine/threonine protein kinase